MVNNNLYHKSYNFPSPDQQKSAYNIRYNIIYHIYIYDICLHSFVWTSGTGVTLVSHLVPNMGEKSITEPLVDLLKGMEGFHICVLATTPWDEIRRSTDRIKPSIWGLSLTRQMKWMKWEIKTRLTFLASTGISKLLVSIHSKNAPISATSPGGEL